VKRCSKCKINKKNSDFAKQKNTKDNLSAYCKTCKIANNRKYRSTKEGYLYNTLNRAKVRAKNKNINFDLNIEYLQSIATEKCPVFNVDLFYYSSFNGQGHPDKQAAALDRIIPELGYVKENVVFISQWANTIKSNATEKELYLVADWVHEARKKVNAKQNTTTPVPTGPDQQGEIYPKLGPISTTRPGEDDDNPDDYCGADARQDADHRTQTRGGDSVGHGSQKVGAPIPVTRIEDHGQPDSKIISLELRRADLFNKP
jgi:hypothetical protein